MTDDKSPPAPGTPDFHPARTNPPSPGAISAEPMALPPIPLNPAPATKRSAKPSATAAKKDTEPKDTFRELIETIVFVVVLVLMLKTFLAEAFVIPTGSMADTLLGYHHKVTCRQCGYPNLVNASGEAEGQQGERLPVVSCQCQNCGFTNNLGPAAPRGGQP